MSFESSPTLNSLENSSPLPPSLVELKETAEGDELLEELHEDVESGAHRYFDSVLKHERVAQVQKHRISEQEYRELHERLDHSRRITHDSLCTSLRVLARAERKMGRDAGWWDKISGPHGENRKAIGRWALKAVFDELNEKEGKKHE